MMWHQQLLILAPRKLTLSITVMLSVIMLSVIMLNAVAPTIIIVENCSRIKFIHILLLLEWFKSHLHVHFSSPIFAV
jgi:hypothetical protein